MSQYSSKDCVLLVDGYNLLGINTELSLSVEALTEPSTPYGGTSETHQYVGIKRADVTQNGYYDDASGSVNDALNEQQGESRILCVGVAGNVAGRCFTGCQGQLEAKFNRIASMGAMHRADAAYQSNGLAEEGRILHALDEETAAGNTEDDDLDNTVATDYGGSAYLHVTALDLGGYDNLVVKVRHSDDGETWADLVTFTAVTAAPAAERKAIAAGDDSIKRYLAVSWAFTGTGSDPSATFFVGAVRDAE